MRLPRWTAYPALAVVAVLLITAIPTRTEEADAAGAARDARARAGAPEASAELARSERPRVVVLGFDGMDPDILRETMERFPELMKHFHALAREGQGVLSLGTSTPPQSPVAWSNFITGMGPGGHGIFDFIHRDPSTYGSAPSTVTTGHSDPVDLPGPWQFPVDEGGDTNRTGKAFWTLLAEAGVPADVWSMPINFPVEPSLGLSFSGMMTPAVDSAYGEYSFYSTDPPIEGGEKVFPVVERDGVIRTSLLGPANAFRDGSPREKIPLTVYVDYPSQRAAVQVGGDGGPVVVLGPGEWSDFVPVRFELLPMGAMGMSGIVRFYLRSVEPEFELYASPINVDPKDPINPVSLPESASADLADAIGYYYTQGMAEDVGALKQNVLSDEEFMRQSALVQHERERMLDYALDRYARSDEGGLLFFYYSSIDLCGHMMWRHGDPEHPFHDPEIAAQDSSWWSAREGSTWKDVIQDLYLEMDPILGRIRSRVGDEALIVVMSDHGFAPYRRKFSLNTWLLEQGYLVLEEGRSRELSSDDPAHSPVFVSHAVDWSRTKAYGMGFNGLYLNLTGRESEGIVRPGAEQEALAREIAERLEALVDPETGERVVLNADLASEVYRGERVDEAPDVLVGYNVGYGNSDEASIGRIPAEVLSDNTGGTFNGSHLMDPRVVPGVLLTNARVALEDPRLEDLTFEILHQYGVSPAPGMTGRPAFD